MSVKTSVPTVIEEVSGVPKAVVDRSIELAFALVRADIADPSVLDGVPNGASLALIPDDDPELAAYAIEAGVTGVKHGKNVYFLHLTHDADGALAIKWPEDTLPPLDGDKQ
jgi:hypothetical protein